MVVHFVKQIEHSSLIAQSEALRSSWPDDKNGSLLFYITISSVVSYAIYFGAGGFLYVNFAIHICFLFRCFDYYFNDLIVILVVFLCASTG